LARGKMGTREGCAKMENKEYHKLVWKTARDNTEAYFRSDIRNWIGNLFTAIFTGFAVPYFLYRLSGIVMFNPLLQLAIIIASAFLGLSLFVLLVDGVNGFWIVPAQLHRTKLEEIKEKESEIIFRTWKNVEFLSYYFEKYEMVGVGLKIISHKNGGNHQIHGCGKIESIVLGQTKIYDDRLPLLLPFVFQSTTTVLRWEPCDIYSDEARIAIANWDDNQAWFYDPNQKKDLILSADEVYLITIRMNGRLLFYDSQNLSDCLLVYKIKYSKDKDGKMKVFIEFFHRSD
jgi:hypothetical protein